jgi:hypothetical protein
MTPSKDSYLFSLIVLSKKRKINCCGEKRMSEKENKTNKQETKQPTAHTKEVRRYTGANKNVSEKLNEAETGIRQSRGKKQRRQFKLAPNRG